MTPPDIAVRVRRHADKFLAKQEPVYASAGPHNYVINYVPDLAAQKVAKDIFALLDEVERLTAELAAAREALQGIARLEVYSVHTGYDETGSYVWSDCVRTDTYEFSQALKALKTSDVDEVGR